MGAWGFPGALFYRAGPAPAAGGITRNTSTSFDISQPHSKKIIKYFLLDFITSCVY